MRICIDARWIFPEITGIGLYTQELIAALARRDHSNHYLLLFQHRAVMERTRMTAKFDRNSHFSTRLIPEGPFSPATQWWMPGLLEEERCDVYHSTNFMMPLWRTVSRTVVTIHDLIPLLFPDYAPRSLKTRLFPIYRGIMRRIGSKADMIITVSDSTRRDVLRELAVPASRSARVVCIPEGVDPFFRPGDRPRNREEKVVLYVGRRDPYKNLPMLVDSIAKLRARGVAARLRVIGPPDARYPEALHAAERLKIAAHVDWIGYVTPDQLRREYQTADAFCLPSRYEGFGLTVLEAMACGTPVICSNTSSLPEVAGDAARLFDPAVPTQLVDAIADVLTRPAYAADLGQRGLIRARSFTWDRTADLTIEAYERAAS